MRRAGHSGQRAARPWCRAEAIATYRPRRRRRLLAATGHFGRETERVDSGYASLVGAPAQARVLDCAFSGPKKAAAAQPSPSPASGRNGAFRLRCIPSARRSSRPCACARVRPRRSGSCAPGPLSPGNWPRAKASWRLRCSKAHAMTAGGLAGVPRSPASLRLQRPQPQNRASQDERLAVSARLNTDRTAVVPQGIPV